MTIGTPPTHAPSLRPDIAPGGHYARVVSGDHDKVISEHAMASTLTPEGIRATCSMAWDAAMRWLEQHEGDVVFAYLYNGSTGECVDLELLAWSDLRATTKGEPRGKLWDLEEEPAAPEEAA